MKKTIYLLLSLLLALAPFAAQAQSKQPKSYQISRAEEYLSEYDYEKARECINKELAVNPKSAEAYNMLGFIHLVEEESGKALTALNTALKYYDKKDKEGRALCCYYLALTHTNLNDTTQIVHYYKEAMRYDHESFIYPVMLANIYISLAQYDEAEEIYTQLNKKHPGETLPIVGLARIAYERKQYEKAKAYTERAALMGHKDKDVHTMLMRIAFCQDDYQTGLEETIKVLDADVENNEAYCTLLFLADTLYTNTVNVLKRKSLSDTMKKEFWIYTLSYVYDWHGDYPNALKSFKELQGYPAWEDVAMERQIDIYEKMGHSPKVLAYCNKFLTTYPDTEDRAEYLCKRGDAEFCLGMLEEARKDFEEALALGAGYDAFCYERLGWTAEMQHDYEQALELYEKSSVLNEDYAFIYMMQGNLLLHHFNRPQEARKCFQKCIEVEGGEIEQNTCRQYAYLGLGNRAKAIEITDSLLAAFPDKAGTYYDAACVYSRLNEKTTALRYLQTCLEKGYLNIPHIQQDSDMDNIRDTKEFKQLMEQYTKIYEAEMAKDPQDVDEEDEEGLVTYEIPIVRQPSGTYLIRASINGLAMDFILDTGCSDISLSSVESEFMLKNGYLRNSDLKGARPYTNANGETYYSREVTLREICLGDLTLKNIHAGIVPNQNAPLLLGQSVLSKFGKVEIDYKNMVLRIKVKE